MGEWVDAWVNGWVGLRPAQVTCASLLTTTLDYLHYCNVVSSWYLLLAQHAQRAADLEVELLDVAHLVRARVSGEGCDEW